MNHLFHREFLSENVAQFAKETPYLTVYVRQRPGRHPRIVAEFCMSPFFYSSS